MFDRLMDQGQTGPGPCCPVGGRGGCSNKHPQVHYTQIVSAIGLQADSRNRYPLIQYRIIREQAMDQIHFGEPDMGNRALYSVSGWVEISGAIISVSG